ncbi:hypothetical protein BDD12DRAFT_2490 [Trichophaea hybrida]|nr:hypothetical protein BDD12DRAFT_2490 [Trichophaea hybrida]
MAQRDKDKERKLIAKLEAHQAAEIRCLQALHGLSSEEDIGVDGKDIDIEQEDASVTANRSASPDSSMQSKDLAKSSPDEGLSANSQPLHSQVQPPIPKEWDAEWDNDLLRQRIEERTRNPGCGGDQWKSSLLFALIEKSVTNARLDFPNVDPQDPAAGFINSTALQDLGRFTFKRDPSAPEESGVAGNVYREINAFTPSALGTNLLSNAKDDHHDYFTIYAVLRRHLSTSNADRNYYYGHGFDDELGSPRHVRESSLFLLIKCNQIVHNTPFL